MLFILFIPFLYFGFVFFDSTSFFFFLYSYVARIISAKIENIHKILFGLSHFPFQWFPFQLCDRPDVDLFSFRFFLSLHIHQMIYEQENGIRQLHNINLSINEVQWIPFFGFVLFSQTLLPLFALCLWLFIISIMFNAQSLCSTLFMWIVKVCYP